MSDIRKRLLPPFLVFSGIVCLSAYPLHLIWPSGWEWGMEGRHYLHMILVVYATLGVFLILAARTPPRTGVCCSSPRGRALLTAF